jgi:nitroimidazol reductase NimA-like FMN-containing flavoprotein (pyridoxamine 5'-phosphate oxidase superfamily)
MTGSSVLEELSLDECLVALRDQAVGRIAVVVDEFPVVLPVNYRLVEMNGRSWIAVRTRSGNVLDSAAMHAAFEIDGFVRNNKEGWSVLVRGTLHHIDAAAADFCDRFDPKPWVTADRDSWLAIDPFSITGRRLRATEVEWPFEPSGYL